MFITGLWPTAGSVVARHHISTKALFSSTVQALSSISFFSIIRFTLSKDAKYVCMYDNLEQTELLQEEVY